MNIDNNAHSVFLLRYHLILTTQYRCSVFDDIVSKHAKEIFERIAADYNIRLEEWSYKSDYIHIVFRTHPNTELSKFINAYKSASSRLIKKDIPRIRSLLWNDRFWSQSFFLLTEGTVSDDVIAEYISQQKML